MGTDKTVYYIPYTGARGLPTAQTRTVRAFDLKDTHPKMSSTSTYLPARKRQRGAERRTEPLPTVHPLPSDRKVTFSRIAIVLTVSFWVIYVVTTIIRQF